MTIKSAMPVYSGSEWRVRVRMQPESNLRHGRELFYGIGAKYTMHQAQIYADSLVRDYARHKKLP